MEEPGRGRRFHLPALPSFQSMVRRQTTQRLWAILGTIMQIDFWVSHGCYSSSNICNGILALGEKCRRWNLYCGCGFWRHRRGRFNCDYAMAGISILLGWFNMASVKSIAFALVLCCSAGGANSDCQWWHKSKDSIWRPLESWRGNFYGCDSIRHDRLHRYRHLWFRVDGE